ncbi:terpene synthase family protein [Oceanobacillus sojae]|uniref:terpene synthase family protein n=1 Tax=Oceanobacillus sojae TaxID=582851 RepID=UPI003641A8E4
MGDVKNIPKLEYVFKGGISPYAMDVQRSTIDWARDFKILNKDTTLNKYENYKLGYLASRAQPYDSFSDIAITSDFMLLSVMLDDYSEEVLDTVDFTTYSDNIINILKGNKTNIKKDYFLIGWENWWERVKLNTPLEWQSRIIKSLTECFKSTSWEIINRLNNQVPKVEEYIINRQHTGSAFICFDLAERGGKRYCPEDARNDLFIELIQSASNIANWTNDIFSLEKEVKNGDNHNLAISIQNQSQISMQDSLRRVEQMLDFELDKYKDLKHELLTENNLYKETREKYLVGVEAAVRGQYEWGLRTGRF